MRLSPDQRFELHHYTHDDDSYQYSYTTNYWFIRSVETGDELYHFEGTDNEDRDGRTREGTDSVSFSQDSAKIIETKCDGTRLEHPLPVKIEYAARGVRIKLIYEDGHTEDRERKRMVHFTKYGQPTFYPLVNDPSGTVDPNIK